MLKYNVIYTNTEKCGSGFETGKWAEVGEF